MTIQEADKVIADYMGIEGQFPDIKSKTCNICGEQEAFLYSESLDSLVPVWERIPDGVLSISFLSSGVFNHQVEVFDNDENLKYVHKTCLGITGPKVSIQEAACIATAKAIRELL